MAYDPQIEAAYRKFLAFQPGDLVELRAAEANEEGEEAESIHQRVLAVADVEGQRYLLIADASELAAQDGAEVVYGTASILGFNEETGFLAEVDQGDVWAQVSAVFSEQFPNFTIAHGSDLEDALFFGTEDENIGLEEYQALQAEWDERYIKEPPTILSALLMLQEHSARLGQVIIDGADLIMSEDEQESSDHETLMRECEAFLGAMLGDLLRLATGLGVNVQEAYHGIMAAAEHELATMTQDVTE